MVWKSALWGLVLSLAFAAPALAQVGEESSPDPRVKKLLDELHLKYEISPNGNYRLINDVGNDRTQLVIIDSETNTYDGMEIREIWSTGFESSGPLSAQVANALLDDTMSNKLALWATYTKNDGKHSAILVARISANANARTLRTAIEAVNQADKMELKLTNGADEF